MTPPAVILSRTQMGENVGAAARAMKNFGLSELRLIAPKCEWPNDRAQMLASGAGDILDRATIHPTAAEALADVQLVLATTARGRDVTRDILTPAEAAARLREAAGRGIRTALLFGGERAGLDNDEISLCDALITIPTAPVAAVKDSELKMSSLNLGQAVLLLGYEWLKSADTTPGIRIRPSIAVPAPRRELVDLFDHLERELDAGGFFFPAAKKGAMVRNIRAMILKSGLTDQQARTIRGMIVALVRNKYRGQE
ncbi:MAG: RNA methyltransferase [Caulobacteraceae bacterium]|nr:MAG: RNA methyltransferase [Caulobacteraceae bacterium]